MINPETVARLEDLIEASHVRSEWLEIASALIADWREQRVSINRMREALTEVSKVISGVDGEENHGGR